MEWRTSRSAEVLHLLYEEWKKTQSKQITEEQLLSNLNEHAERKSNVHHKGSIIVQGMDDVAVHFSKCCAPVPGDEIIGYVTRGRGVTIHRTDCVNMLHLPDSDKVRLIDAETRVIMYIMRRFESSPETIRVFCWM